MSENKNLQFQTLAGGAVAERFGDALQQVLDNIIDPNTDPKKERKVMLTVKFKPNEDRDLVGLEVGAVPTLAPPKPISTSIIIDRDNTGNAVAAERQKGIPGQIVLEDAISSQLQAPSKVFAMK